MLELKKTKTLERVINNVKDHEIDSLKLENGELPNVLRQIILETKFRTYSGDFNEYLTNTLNKLRLYDYVMGYIHYIESVHSLRYSISENKEKLDDIIGKTTLANTCYAVLDCILDLENNDIVNCKISRTSKDIRILTEPTVFCKDLLKDQYDLLLHTSDLGCVIEDILYFKDKLYTLVTTGKDIRIPKNSKIKHVNKILNSGNLDKFENKSTLVINENNILAMTVCYRRLYDLHHLILEIRNYDNEIYDVIIPQTNEINNVLTDNIRLYMTYLKDVIEGKREFI